MNNYELLTESVCNEYPVIGSFVESLDMLSEYIINESIEISNDEDIDSLIETVYDLLPEAAIGSDIEQNLLYEAVMYILEFYKNPAKKKMEKISKELDRSLQSMQAKGKQNVDQSKLDTINKSADKLKSAGDEYLKRLDKKPRDITNKDLDIFDKAKSKSEFAKDVINTSNNKEANAKLDQKYMYPGKGRHNREDHLKRNVRKNHGNVPDAEKDELLDIAKRRLENKKKREEQQRLAQEKIDAKRAERKEQRKNQISYEEKQKRKFQAPAVYNTNTGVATVNEPKNTDLVPSNKSSSLPAVRSNTNNEIVAKSNDVESTGRERASFIDNNNSRGKTALKAAGNWIKNNPGKTAAGIAGAAALTAGGIYAAKKIKAKRDAAKKANKEHVKENYEYEEYPILCESIISNLTEEELFAENCLEFVSYIADYMVENADILD